MKLVFSVFDIKAKLFSMPFFSHSRSTAVRDFSAAVRDSGSSINKFPYDYELWELGTWDDESGVLSQHSAIQFVIRGNQLNEE